MCLIVVQISQWWSLWFLKPLETELVAQMIEHQERVDGTLFAPDLGCVASWMLEDYQFAQIATAKMPETPQ